MRLYDGQPFNRSVAPKNLFLQNSGHIRKRCITSGNQLLMVAADVDNDLFHGGETIDRGEGDGIANLAYRVTSLYIGLDSTLGLSAGLKHFGKRRLGRSGLYDPSDVADNVWDVDCSQFFRNVDGIHSAYFEVVKTQRLMQQVLRGVDRRVLIDHFGLRRTSEH